ncbi:isoleucine--tRNA ligase [Patescibacteria group bacterium]|nr:isoleucine--tRNA ligase [Patescibacteria group bacterium]
MSFKLPDKKQIPEMEDEILSYWKKNNIFKKSVEKNSEDNLYVFYDGPPFISGLPHYGHLLVSIAKDVIPRFWTMKGKRVERVWGWDAHGLTVENRVQEELGIENRRDIESYGLEKFTQVCYEYTSKISAEWEWYVDKIGRWVDFKNAYRTTDQKYMESVMWAFKQIYEKGLIYEGTRTSLFCPTCGTPVSDFEIAMDNSYREENDLSITVRFRVITEGDFKDYYLLAWTTTPWTLPSNRALVVDDQETYVSVQFENNTYILAKKRLDFVFSDKNYEIKEEFLGKEIIGLEYEPLFTFYASKEGEFKVYSYEGMVTMEEGTGVVHSAPGFGEVDTEMGKHFNLTLMMTLDDEGKMLPGNQDANPYEGMFYLKANAIILNDLVERGVIFKNEKTTHRVPYHDRCNTLLVQKAQNSWFIDIQKIKGELIKNNEDINWVPEYVKHGIFEKTIEQAPDWCISRNRFWATPMPVWESKDGDRLVFSSIKEIEEASGQKVKDLHRPYIDEIVINKNGKEYRRRPEVLDSWMEAGSMSFAQLHYPFENREKFEKNYPGDYIVEYKGQVRAWFQRMHIISTLIFNSRCFNNVVVTGVMAGTDGRKMSKTYKNYPDPRGIMEKYGGDALRLYFMGSSLMSGENTNFDETELKNKQRNILNPLWNSAVYFLMYAQSNNWSSENKVISSNVLDKWIIIRLNQTISDIDKFLKLYNVPPAVKSLEGFIDDLSRWYVRRSRDRISSGDNEALSTLYTVLLEFSKASAPLIPFISENIYRTLQEENLDEKSVHLCDYPVFNNDLTDESQKILINMKKTRDIVSQVLSVRVEKAIPVRQVLSSSAILKENDVPEEYKKLILEETNIKNIEVVDSLDEKPMWETDLTNSIKLNIEITEDLLKEGKAREFIRNVQDIRKEMGLQISDEIVLTYQDSSDMSEIISLYGDEIKNKLLAKEIIPGEEIKVEKL